MVRKFYWVFYIFSFGFSASIFYLLRTFMTNIDENDHIVIGFLMQNGRQVYSDIFTNHFPFPYYMTNLFAYLWVNQPFYRAISIFRLELLVFYLLSFAGVFAVLKNSSIKIAFCIWIILAAITASLYHGNLVLSETFAAICISSIFWLTIPNVLKLEKNSQLKIYFSVILAAIGFWTQPFLIVLFAVPFFLASKKDFFKILLTEVLLVVIPLLYFLFTGQLKAFFEQTIIFNFSVYSKMFPEQISNQSMFVQNIGDFFRNEFLLFTSLNGPIQIFQFAAHLSVFVILFLMIKSKNIKGFLLFLILFGASRVRDIKVIPGELFNFGIYPLILFSTACAVLLIFSKDKIVRISAVFICVILFITSSISFAPIFNQSLDGQYNYHVFWSDREKIGKTIQNLTSPEDKILIYPHDVDLYFFAKRQPIDRFTYWFPWINSVPEYRNERLKALEENPPAVIYIGNLAYKDNPDLYKEFFPGLLDNYKNASEEGKPTNIWVRKD